MIIDSHLHFSLPSLVEDVLEALDLTNCQYGNLVVQINTYQSSETLDCLFAKAKSNHRLYTYGSLDPTEYIKRTNMGENLIEHVKKIMKCGCDGIKMLEGKPDERKRFPIPDFDSEEFDKLFSYLEKEKINIILHVNDPEEFWDETKIPEWAKREGWFYDESYVNNLDQYRQVEKVLKKHPNLHITFAHFFFLSKNLEKLSKLFDSYPNISVDITPGIELFTNLSQNIKEARTFFIKYADRIIYGTDISHLNTDTDREFNKEDAIIRGNLCYSFLTKEKVNLKGNEKSLLGKEDLEINGLNLPSEVVKKICYSNFYNKNGQPKEINKEEILQEIERERKRITFLSKYYKFKPDYTKLDSLKTYFEQ